MMQRQEPISLYHLIHLPSIDVIETLYELYSCALSTAAGTHQSHRLPRTDLQVQPPQNLDTT